MGSVELQISPAAHLADLPSSFEIDCETPASVHLVLQTLLPLLLYSQKPPDGFTLHIKGGTMVPFSPSFISQQFVFFPLLARLGFCFEYELVDAGLFMSRMGRIRLKVDQTPKVLKSVELVEKGLVEKVRVFVCLK